MLPSGGSAWRDSNEAAESDVGCADKKSGHCEHHKLHPFAYHTAPDNNPTAPDNNPLASSVSSVKETITEELEDVEEHITSVLQDPLGNPVMFGILLLLVLSCIIGLICACCRTFTEERSELEDAKRAGRQVNNGTVLVCICKDEEIAEVITAAGSDETIGKVAFGEKRIAAGPVEEFVGNLFVPIQPRGVVKLTHFKEEQALTVVAGTILVCKIDEASFAYIFEGISSPLAICRLRNGERVVARRGAQWSCDGRMMIPIRPKGAVELTFFEPKEGVTGDMTEAWLKGELEGAQEIDEKLQGLRAQKTQIMLEQAARKRKLESIKQQMLEHEAELLGKSGPTDEEIKKRSDESLNKANKATQRGVLMAVAYAAPMVKHSQKIYQSIDTKMKACKKRSEELILEEVKLFSKEIQEVMGFEDLAEVDTSVTNDIDIPTLACIMASAFAPAQLNLLYAINKAFFGCSVLFLLLDLIVLVFDWNTPCIGKPVVMPPNPSLKEIFHTWWQDASDNPIYLWFLADGVVHLFCLLVRLPVVYIVRAQLDKLERLQNGQHDIFVQDEEQDAQDIAVVMKQLVEYYMTTGFATLQQLDRVLRSYWVFLANFSIIFDVVWISYGTYLVWNTPWFECAATGIILLRIRSTIFLILLVFYLLQLSLFCMGQLMQSENFSVRVINVGDGLDEAMQLGLPLFKVIFHALVVRHSSDMIAIQVNIHNLERRRLAQKQAVRMAQLQEVNFALDTSNRLIESLEYKNAMHSMAFKEHATMQEELNRMKTQLKQDSFGFSKRISDRAIDATKQAEVKLEEWEHRGGPDILAAATQGANMLNQVEALDNLRGGAQQMNATMTAMTENAVEQTQMATERIGQNIIHGEMTTGRGSSEVSRLMEQVRTGAEAGAGGVQSSTSNERRLSQPDEGAGR